MNLNYRVIRGELVAFAILMAAHGGSATAIGDGIPGPTVGFRLVEVGTEEPANGFEMRCCKTYPTIENTHVNGAGNFAVAKLPPIETDQLSYVVVHPSIDVIASGPGTAYASVRQVVIAFPRNVLDTSNIFDVIGFYGVNAAISVDDQSRESVHALWTVQLSFGGATVPMSSLGEVERFVNCDLEAFTPDACPRSYGGATARFGPFSLEPGEHFDALLWADMSLQAIVEAEPAAISEPSSLALLSIGCIALIALRPIMVAFCATSQHFG